MIDPCERYPAALIPVPHSASSANLHLLVQFSVHRAPLYSLVIAQHVGRQVPGSWLTMAYGGRSALRGRRRWRIVLAGRGIVLSGRRIALGECCAQQGGASDDHGRQSGNPCDDPWSGTARSAFRESWFHARLLANKRRSGRPNGPRETIRV